MSVGGSLPPRLVPLVELSAAIAARDAGARAAWMRRAESEADPAAVEETLLQLHLFLGFPAALEALREWRETSRRPAPVEPDPGPGHGRERGEEVCARVYAGSYGRLRENVRRLHPALERWMVEDGYGKVLGRPGLDLVARELCIVAMLAVAAREPQLHSHLRGALNAGAAAEEVELALEIGLARSPAAPPWPARARALWRHVRGASGPTGTPERTGG